MSKVVSLALCSAALASLSIFTPAQDQPIDHAKARAAIVEGNREWGKARVAYDRATMETMITSDFYVKIGEQRLTGKEFLDQVSDKTGRALLTRFDVDVLTVQKRGDIWVAVIAEKLEMQSTGPDGKKVKMYSLWITQDGWKQNGGKWQVAFSEAIGWESWRGEKPPFDDW